MNFKHFFLFLAVIAFAACSDEMSLIGSSIQPDTDRVNIIPDTIDLSDAISTFKVDSIYALSTSALIGNLTDITYGNTQCDFMAQFNCVDNFTSIDSATYNKAHHYSTTITLLYKNFWGNENEPMQISAYQLNNALSREIYSNTNTAKYCNKSTLLGRKSYTAKFKMASDVYDSIEIKLNDSFSDQLRDALKDPNNSIFKNDATFKNFFKGVYITNNSGSGSIVKADSITLNFNYYTTKTKAEIKEKDSIIVKSPKNDTTKVKYTVYVFDGYTRHSKSVKANQLAYLVNRYNNSNLPIPANTDNFTYIKSPAGLFNRINIPMKAIAEKVGKSRLNGAKLTIYAERPDDATKTLLPAPKYLMLIKESELVDFFKNKTQFDDKKHAYATFSSSTNSYTFTNISKIFTKHLNETGIYTGEESVSFVLLPVAVDETSSPVGIRHSNSPTAIKLLKKGLNLSLVIAK